MKVSDLFEIEYGQSLSLNKLRQVGNGEGVAFVSRTARNNGVSAWVAPVVGVEPLPAGLLTVCLRSRNYTLSTFVQPRPFYCGYHIFVLTPKTPMSLQEKLWWAECIRENRFRFNFGRQANRSLSDLDLPDRMPSWVEDVQLPELGEAGARRRVPDLDQAAWKSFRLDSLFDLKRGQNILKRSMTPGATPYIGASADNNGVTAWIDVPAQHSAGSITVSSNGSVGEAFYQNRPFVASGDVTVLEPKTPLGEAEGLFICTLIFAEKYRWNYGRKWVVSRMKESEIRLPVLKDGTPNWEFMKNFVAGLPLYSLLNSRQDASGL